MSPLLLSVGASAIRKDWMRAKDREAKGADSLSEALCSMLLCLKEFL